MAELVSDMKGTLKDILKHTRRNLKVVMPVISPYLGGIDAAELDSSSADKGRECTQLKVAVFNPGRTGLIALSSEEILWWRLGHISCGTSGAGCSDLCFTGRTLASGSQPAPCYSICMVGRSDHKLEISCSKLRF